MNKREQKRYAMNLPEEEYNSPEMRTSLWQVLDVARRECGFCTDGARMLVQIYPMDSGCEIFITKIGRLSTAAERNIARSGSVTMLSSKSTLYKFQDLSTLIDAMRHIKANSIPLCKDVYLTDQDACYLLVDERTGSVPISELSFLSEFATDAPITLLTHLSEHARRISANDVFTVINKSTVAG